MMKTGYNKCIGAKNGTSEELYMEEMEQDPIQYRKNVRQDVWKGVNNGRTMMNATTLNNYRNINRERANIF